MQLLWGHTSLRLKKHDEPLVFTPLIKSNGGTRLAK